MPYLPTSATTISTTVAAVAAVLGILSLFFGRRLFYLFVALVGFVLGLALATSLLAGAADRLRLAAGVVVGIVFAVLAVLLQRPAAALAGFFVFGAIGRLLAASIAASPGPALVLFLVFGVVGLVLVWLLFDWGLIVSSALAGAALIVLAVRAFLTLPPAGGIVLFVVLALAGIFFQSRFLRATLP